MKYDKYETLVKYITEVAVSYTHLDVYKRQVVYWRRTVGEVWWPSGPAALPKAQPPGIAQATDRRVTTLWRDRQHRTMRGRRRRGKTCVATLPGPRRFKLSGERTETGIPLTRDVLRHECAHGCRHDPALAPLARAPRRFHRTPHRPQRRRGRGDAAGGRP